MLDSLVRVSRRVVKLSKAEAPLTRAIILSESSPEATAERVRSRAMQVRHPYEPHTLAGGPDAINNVANQLLKHTAGQPVRDTGALRDKHQPRGTGGSTG